MSLKTVQDVMKSHQEFLQKVAEQINAVKQGRPLPVDLPASEQAALLAQAGTRLDTVRKAKEAAAQHFDEEIQQQEAAIAQLKATVVGGGVQGAISSPADVAQTPQVVKAAPADAAQASPAAKAEAVEEPVARKARKADPPAGRRK